MGQRKILRGKRNFVRAAQPVENVDRAAGGHSRLPLQHQPAEGVGQPAAMALPVAARIVEAPPPVGHRGGRVSVPALNRRDDQKIGQLAPVGQE